MALTVSNSASVDVRLAFVWPTQNAPSPWLNCGPFATYAKWGWYQIARGQSYLLWNIDLTVAMPPNAGFYAEGGGQTWGSLPPGSQFNAFVPEQNFNQCLYDQTSCTKRIDCGTFALNASPGLNLRLLSPASPE